MKKNLRFFIGLAMVLAIVAFIHAQSITNPSSKLAQAIALLNTNGIMEAHKALAAIDRNDPDYAAARCYDALCLYQLDKRKFLSAMEKPEIQMADVPEELREDLDYKQIDALFFYRKFEEVLPKVDEFADQHFDSPRLPAIAEYRMASLYERGTKKMIESGFLQTRKDTAGAEKRLHEGEDNLAQFLKLAANGADSYLTLTNRNLQTEVTKAFTALGGEDEALKLVSPMKREDAALAILQLQNKIEPLAMDKNLCRMTNFLNEFPNTKYRKRVMFEMASVALNKGSKLAYQAEHAVDSNISVEKRAAAALYFDMSRDLFNHVIEDKGAGISDADVQNSREETLRSFYLQGDWAGLSNQAIKTITNSPPGGKEWIAAKLYDAAGLFQQRKMTEASNELDELLAIGFKNHPSYDGLLVSAAAWRVNVAMETHDDASARRVTQMVQSSNCYASLKRDFLKRFQRYLTQPDSTSN